MVCVSGLCRRTLSSAAPVSGHAAAMLRALRLSLLSRKRISPADCFASFTRGLNTKRRESVPARIRDN